MHHCSFSRVFSAAHRVWNDSGKCHNIHGHNYRVEVDVMTEKLNEQNFVIPFDAIKECVDSFDHTLILDAADPLIDVFVATGLALSIVDGVPSTEFLAHLIATRLLARMPEEATVSVDLRETDGIEAMAGVSK